MSAGLLSKRLYSTRDYNGNYKLVGSVNFPGGNGNYLSVASTSAVGFGTADYTAEAWIRPGSGTSGSQIIMGGSSGRWALRLGSSFGASLNGLQITMSQTADYDNCSFTFTAGTWYHIAVARQSGTVRFFVDGTQRTTGNTGNGGTNWSNETSLGIGNNASNNEHYKGEISNARIVKGTALYTATFTAPTAPLSVVSGTSLLTCQSPATITDASGNAWAITVNGTAAASTASPFA